VRRAELQAKLSRTAHPQKEQRLDVAFGKQLEVNSEFPESSSQADNMVIQPPPINHRDTRVGQPSARGYAVVGVAGVGASGSVRYVLSLVVDTDSDALATATLSPSGIEFEAGTIVVATAIPSSGYHFVQWDLSWGSWSSTDNPLSVTMDSNKTITARIEAD
jgi:hypothetical protein